MNDVNLETALDALVFDVKYHPVQPRRNSGQWTLPSGEHHPLNGGRLDVTDGEQYVDVRFSTIKTFEPGSGVVVELPEHAGIATGFKDWAGKGLVLSRLYVDLAIQRKGVGTALLAELGQQALAKKWDYLAGQQFSERGRKYMAGLMRRGLAAQLPNGAGWRLHADKLAEKYRRIEAKE